MVIRVVTTCSEEGIQMPVVKNQHRAHQNEGTTGWLSWFVGNLLPKTKVPPWHR